MLQARTTLSKVTKVVKNISITAETTNNYSHLKTQAPLI